LKHGLFAIDLYINSMTEWEDPDQYQKLLERLTESYQPVGLAEELEVQQIAACWWKRARAWRYENAEIAVRLWASMVALGRSQLISSASQPRLALLKKAELEEATTGKLSEELKERIFGDAECAELWKLAEQQVIEDMARRLGLPLAVISDARDSEPESDKKILRGTARAAALIHMHDNERLAAALARHANDVEAIPRAEVLDRLLRAEAAIERSLNLSIERLEYLQRRRTVAAVLPPGSR
jgi:hypothetical protein